MQDIIYNIFKETYNQKPVIIKSPGRVNLIGEHTDYNEGFVLPAAVDKSIYIGIAPRTDNKINLYSHDYNAFYNSDLASYTKSEDRWPNYLLGVVDQLLKNGYSLKGFDLVFGGDIPIGAGMSSSAAIEGGLAFSLNHIFDLGIEKIDLVKFAQKAENQFVGVNCGIMDQYINIFGKEHNVLKIDCRSFEYEYVPFTNDNIRIVLCNTMVTHSLASSEYNTRRLQCENGVELLKKFDTSIGSLRDVNRDFLFDHKNEFDPVTFSRCKYVVEENLRLEAFCAALRENNFSKAGSIMFLAHEGLSKEYEVSCKELDILVELAASSDGVLGSRMMGGGFGGCTINLVQNDSVEEFSGMIKEEYYKITGKIPEIYTGKIESGTRIINL